MIFSYMDPEEVQKVPEKILDFINNHYDKNYIPQIDQDIPLDSQEIKKDTKIMLSIFYRYYWCENEKRERLLEEDRKALAKFKQQMKQSYRLEEVLASKKNVVEAVSEPMMEDEVHMVSTSNLKWYQKVFNKLSAIFKK